LARARFYRERSWEALIGDARAAGLPRRQLDGLAAWPRPDRKAADARLLLRALGRPAAPPPRLPGPRTWARRRLEAGGPRARRGSPGKSAERDDRLCAGSRSSPDRSADDRSAEPQGAVRATRRAEG